jgi:hypothetical protein
MELSTPIIEFVLCDADPRFTGPLPAGVQSIQIGRHPQAGNREEEMELEAERILHGWQLKQLMRGSDLVILAAATGIGPKPLTSVGPPKPHYHTYIVVN